MVSESKHITGMGYIGGSKEYPIYTEFEPAFIGMEEKDARSLESKIKRDYELTYFKDPGNPQILGYQIKRNATGETYIFSPNARLTLETRYLEKDKNKQVVENVLDLMTRVAVNIASADLKYNSEADVEHIARDFLEVMLRSDFLPNTPTLCNAGRALQQLSACFVLPVEDYVGTDDIGEDPEKQGNGIFDAARYMAMIHKSGGGTGFNFSRLRPKSDGICTTYGSSSGPVSFLKAPFDASTDAINQGGFRRGANMGILEYWHPDIFEFVHEKQNLYVDKNGKRSSSLENFNLSVGVDSGFMESVKVDGHFRLINPRYQAAVPLEERVYKSHKLFREKKFPEKLTENQQREKTEYDRLLNEMSPSLLLSEDGKEIINVYNKKVVGKVGEDGGVLINSKALFDYIVECAHKEGCPGLIFLDRMNKDNPTPQVSKIESTNPCVIGSTLIATSNGLERIDSLIGKEIEILTNIELSSSDGIIQKRLIRRKIKGAFKTGTKKTYRLITKAGYEVIATSNHKILTSEGWKQLKDVRIADKVIIQSEKSLFNQNAALPFSNKKWTKGLGIMLGWLIGDGWFINKGKNCRAGFVFGKNTIKYLKIIKKTFNKIYGKDIKEIKRPNGTINISYHSREFISFLESLGVKSAKASEKSVPTSILTAPEYAVKGFLQALFSSDGTVNITENKTRYIRLTSKSNRLLKEVQILLLNFGIKSHIYERHRSKRIVFSYKNLKGELKLYQSDGRLYELQISKDMLPLFLKEIGFLYDMHSKKISELKNASYYHTDFIDIVLSIEKHGIEDVFDLTEPSTHSFIANGIIVHNCGEQPLLPYESCNLGSINLANCIENGRINESKIERLVRTAVHFLDNVIDKSKYPTKKIYMSTKGNRKIGLGVMGFADMLTLLGMAYESADAIECGRKVMQLVDKTAKEESEKLGVSRGVFPHWKGSVYDPESEFCKEDKKGKKYRNATVTTIAPTGTISMIADVSSGIEPLFALAYTKTCMDNRELHYTNHMLKSMLTNGGLKHSADIEEILGKIEEKGSIQSLEEISPELKKLFKTAHEITPEIHIKMQIAFQEYVDNAVSKTINLPNSATEEDIANIYMLSYEMGCKGITVFRDHSKDRQVLSKGNNLIELVRKDVGRPSIVVEADDSGKYKITRDQNKDSLHMVVADELHVDRKNKKAYLLPREIFQNRAPLGEETSVDFQQEGIDRTEILKASDPDYAELIKRWKSASSDDEEGIGPRKIKSKHHAVGVMLEYHLLQRGVVSYDEQTNTLVNLARKADLELVTDPKEKKRILSANGIGVLDEEKRLQVNTADSIADFKCECGSTEYYFEAGCHTPKCRKCGQGNGCG